MPRAAKKRPEEVITALKEVQTIFDECGSILKKKDEVWKQVHKKLNGEMSTEYIWQYVHEDRHKSQSVLREHHGLPPLQPQQKSRDDSPDSLSIDGFQGSCDILPSKSFQIHLSAKDWECMKPIPTKQYRDDTKTKVRITLHLQEGWGNVLLDIIYDQHRLPCPHTLKASVASDPTLAEAYVTVHGTCSECGGTARGTILMPPEDGLGVIMYWRATDTRGKFHEKRRQLSGPSRTQQGAACSGKSASLQERHEAASRMDPGDPPPPTLFKPRVLRKAVEEHRAKTLGVVGGTDHVVDKVCVLKRTVPHLGSIHDVSADPVAVSYDTPEQALIYKAYRQKKYTRLTADTTGGVVQRVPRRVPNSGLSGHIFLTELVLSGELQIPIAQLLSEKNNTVKIWHWLVDWLERSGSRVPDEVVCDSAVVLLSSFARAFAGCESLKQYIEIQFKYVIKETDSAAKVFIRKDVAHFIKNVCKWKVWNDDMPKVKDFYIRCVALLVLCTSADDFENILLHILTLAYSTNIGHSDNLDPVPAEESVAVLAQKVGDETAFDVQKILAEQTPELMLAIDLDENDIPTNIKDWVENVKENASRRSEDSSEGDKLSPYRNPELGNKLVDAAMDFVLWTAVLVNYYSSPYLRGTSAGSEGDFADLKGRILAGVLHPLLLDKFILTHLMSINGQTKLAAASALLNTTSTAPGCSASSAITATTSAASASSTFAAAAQCAAKDTDTSEEEIQESAESSELKEDSVWKKKSNPGPARSRTKFFKPSIETRLAQETQVLKPPRSRLLSNGSLLPTLHTEEGTYVLKNTCNLDSLCHLLAAAYVDHPTTRNCMDQSSIPLVKVACSLAKVGATKETYKLRLQAVIHGYQGEEVLTGVKTRTTKPCMTYDCLGSLHDAIRHLLKDSRTCEMKLKCNNRRCKLKTEVYPFVEPDLELVYENGLQCLPAVIDNELDINRKKCDRGKCGGIVTTTCNLQPLLFIDVSENTRSWDLAQFPTNITISKNQVQYRLCGLVAYQPKHTITYVRRLGGNWEAFDNTRNGVLNAVSIKNVLPIFIVYCISTS